MLPDTLRGRHGASTGYFVILLILLTLPLVLSACGSDDSKSPQGEVVKKRMALNLPDDLKEVDLRDVEDIRPPEEPKTVKAEAKKVKPAPKKVQLAPEPAPVQVAGKPKVKWVKPKAPVKKGAVVRKKRTPRKVEAPKPTVTAKKQVVKKRTVSTGSYAISVASFIEVNHANALKKRIDGVGYNAYIASFTKDNVKWFRVRVGFYKSGADADVALTAISKKLNVKGAWVVKPSDSEISRNSR